jgi:hypothetical protein
MEYSPYGALGQVFIIEAIRHYSETIRNTPRPEEHGNGVVSAVTWHDIATDVSKRIKDNYESRRNQEANRQS